MQGDIVAKLRGISLFGDLSAEMLTTVAPIARQKSVDKGTPIFFEGQEGDRFYGICTGSVKIFKLAADGNEQILHIFGQGDIIGEVAVFSGGTFPANARALERCELLVFDRAQFIRLLRRNIELSLKMLAVLSARLRMLTFLVESISLKDVSGRLSSYLLDIGGKEPGWFSLPMDKGQLARMLGTIPETFSRSLRRLQEQGAIEVEGKKIRILDQQRLGGVAKDDH